MSSFNNSPAERRDSEFSETASEEVGSSAKLRFLGRFRRGWVVGLFATVVYLIIAFTLLNIITDLLFDNVNKQLPEPIAMGIMAAIFGLGLRVYGTFSAIVDGPSSREEPPLSDKLE